MLNTRPGLRATARAWLVGNLTRLGSWHCQLPSQLDSQQCWLNMPSPGLHLSFCTNTFDGMSTVNIRRDHQSLPATSLPPQLPHSQNVTNSNPSPDPPPLPSLQSNLCPLFTKHLAWTSDWKPRANANLEIAVSTENNARKGEKVSSGWQFNPPGKF